MTPRNRKPPSKLPPRVEQRTIGAGMRRYVERHPDCDADAVRLIINVFGHMDPSDLVPFHLYKFTDIRRGCEPLMRLFDDAWRYFVRAGLVENNPFRDFDWGLTQIPDIGINGSTVVQVAFASEEERRLRDERKAATDAQFEIARIRHWKRMRQMRKRQATPEWADLAAIQAVFHEAARLEAETGELHEVDHIVPLSHPLVCGLHVHWNLRAITRAENRRKSNGLQCS